MDSPGLALIGILIYAYAILYTLVLVPMVIKMIGNNASTERSFLPSLLGGVVVGLAFLQDFHLPSLELVRYGPWIVGVAAVLLILNLRYVKRCSTRTSLVCGLLLAMGTVGLSHWSYVGAGDAAAGSADSVCGERLKSVGKALEIYCSDWDDKMPPAANWRKALSPYTNHRGLAEDLDKCDLSPSGRITYCGRPPRNDKHYPLVYCYHRALYTRPPRTVVFYSDAKDYEIVPGRLRTEKDKAGK